MNNSIAAKISEKYNITDESRSYWMVRTDGGKNFQFFLDGKFIALGWNDITVIDINSKNNERIIKGKIKKNHSIHPKTGKKIDFETQKGRAYLTSIYNKILNFDELKKGDIVLIPSKGSHHISFGIIDSDDIYEAKDNKCEYTKRKKVNWIKTKNLQELDNIYYKIINTKHSLSSLNPYQVFIDREISNSFIKDGYGHLIFDVNTKEEIEINSLIELINKTKIVANLINNKLKLGDEIEDNSIKINVQSPGAIEFKFKNGVSAILVSIIMSSFISCGSDANAGSSKSDNKRMVLDTISKNINASTNLNKHESQVIVDSVSHDYKSYEDLSKNLSKLEVRIEEINSL